MTRVFFASALLLIACGPPETGGDDLIVTSVTGRVYDAETEDPLANALVETEPFVKQVTTNAEGLYSIEQGLEVGGTYRVTASKADYETNAVNITNIIEGTNTVVDIVLTPEAAALALSSNSVQIQSGDVAGSFRVGNDNPDLPLTWSASSTNAWVTEVAPNSGTVTDTEQTVIVNIDRDALPDGTGEVTGTVEVTSNGGADTVTIRVLR